MTLRNDLFDAQARRANLFDRYSLGEQLPTDMMLRARLILACGLIALAAVVVTVRMIAHA